MKTPTKLAGFALGLAAVFGAALGVGSLVGPVGPVADEPAVTHEDDGAHGDGD